MALLKKGLLGLQTLAARASSVSCLPCLCVAIESSHPLSNCQKTMRMFGEQDFLDAD